MKITVLGSGSWGFTLQLLLAKKGHEVLGWTSKESLLQALNQEKQHPLFKEVAIPDNVRWTLDIEEAIDQTELIVESVTSSGLRPVFETIAEEDFGCPIVITSKGIEQSSLLTLPDVLLEVLGQERKPQISLLSGPSFAKDVILERPTSVVASAFHPNTIKLVTLAFNTPTFRVYPNNDILGVSFGGAVKNVIAVACGISDGMRFGVSARAALITRGLHEIRKIAVACGAKIDTLNGLSGMGDLIATCSSPLSRNYTFGQLIAQGATKEDALNQIGMVVEGAYSVISLKRLSEKKGVPLPITEAVHEIIYEDLSPQMAFQKLMQREVKEEHL